MNKLSIVGKAGDYRLLRVHSCYPRTVVAKQIGTFLSFCFADRYHGYYPDETPFEAAKADIEFQYVNQFEPYEHKHQREIQIIFDIMHLGMEEIEEEFIEFPISFPDYLKSC